MLYKGASYVVEQHLLRKFILPDQLVDALDGEMVIARSATELIPEGTRLLCLKKMDALGLGLMIILNHEDDPKLTRQIFIISEDRAELFLKYLPSQGSF